MTETQYRSTMDALNKKQGILGDSPPRNFKAYERRWLKIQKRKRKLNGAIIRSNNKLKRP